MTEEKRTAFRFQSFPPVRWPARTTDRQKDIFCECTDREPMMWNFLQRRPDRELPARCLICPAADVCYLVVQSLATPIPAEVWVK